MGTHYALWMTEKCIVARIGTRGREPSRAEPRAGGQDPPQPLQPQRGGPPGHVHRRRRGPGFGGPEGSASFSLSPSLSRSRGSPLGRSCSSTREALSSIPASATTGRVTQKPPPPKSAEESQA